MYTNVVGLDDRLGLFQWEDLVGWGCWCGRGGGIGGWFQGASGESGWVVSPRAICEVLQV